MELMRYDMNGAAAVIGAMCAVADNALPRNVVAVVAACENMVDARSYRNGDVFPSMSGKTVYVRNTDAEGRLTMGRRHHLLRPEGIPLRDPGGGGPYRKRVQFLRQSVCRRPDHRSGAF